MYDSTVVIEAKAPLRSTFKNNSTDEWMYDIPYTWYIVANFAAFDRSDNLHSHCDSDCLELIESNMMYALCQTGF